MGVENRLTRGQLSALVPGDVTVEIGPCGPGRHRLKAGTVVRVEPFERFGSSKGPRGGRYVVRYSRRDGRRTSGSGRAELVNGDAVAASSERRGELRQIDRLYWAWHRRPADVESLTGHP